MLIEIIFPNIGIILSTQDKAPWAKQVSTNDLGWGIQHWAPLARVIFHFLFILTFKCVINNYNYIDGWVFFDKYNPENQPTSNSGCDPSDQTKHDKHTPPGFKWSWTTNHDINLMLVSYLRQYNTRPEKHILNENHCVMSANGQLHHFQLLSFCSM